MALKFFCDICDKEVENPIRVEYKSWIMYCENCWIDTKNWKLIHESKKANNEQ